MILYHGSDNIVQKPDVRFSKRYLDFGMGFYTTSYREQAAKWALRKSKRSGKKAYLNIFETFVDLEQYNVLNFKDADEKWLDFVCECRNGEDLNRNYDIVIGNVANDDVFKTIDMYVRKLWDKERTLSELRYYKVNNQICFVQQYVIDEILKFKEAVEILSGDLK